MLGALFPGAVISGHCTYAGYALVSAQLFTVDATRPVPTLTTASASGRGATFAFKATDVTPVTFQCQLERADASSSTAGVQPVPSSMLLPAWNTTVPCGSPAVGPCRTAQLDHVQTSLAPEGVFHMAQIKAPLTGKP